jgi:hypothetical protein
MDSMEDRITLRLLKWIAGGTLIAILTLGGMLGGAVYFLAGLIARHM